MKKILTVMLIIVASFAAGNSQTLSTHPQTISVERKKGCTPQDRPQEPSSQSITCVYDGTHLHISIPLNQ